MGGMADRPSRRDVLKGTLAASTAAALSACAPHPGPAAAPAALRDLVNAENAKPGTRDWLLTHARVDPKTKYRSPWVEGYVSRTSVRGWD